ncbi:uncharacterized protein LOC111849574 isoform X1 [Arapaima gigas]
MKLHGALHTEKVQQLIIQVLLDLQDRMVSVLGHAMSDLIKMTSIERVVTPIATHLCHLILIFENEEVTDQVAGLERAAENVAEAIRSMAAVASRLSQESNDAVTKKEMEPVVMSLIASGQHVLLAAQKLSIHPHQDEHKEELITSTQNVLLGVLKVLLVEDDAALRKIVTVAHLLSDCLSQLEAALSIPLLLNSFQKFSETLLLLNELAWKRAKDLRDTGHREHVFCSLENLKRCISMLHTAMHNSIKQPQSKETQAAKKYILDQVDSTLRDLVSALKSNCSGTSLSQQESYRMKLDGLTNLLGLPPYTLITDSSCDSLLHNIIIHSMVVAKSSPKTLKKTVVDDCRHLLQLWSEISQDADPLDCLSDHKQMQHNNENKYLSLKIQLQKLDCSVVRAILYLLLDVFVMASVAFDDLMNAAGQPSCSHSDILGILQSPLSTFVFYADKMIQVTDFISSLSVNAKDMENVENFSASLKRMKSSVTLLPLEIKENKECSRVLEKLQDLHLQWTEENSFLIDALSHIVDLKEFIGFTVAEMKNQNCSCDRALKNENHIQFKEHASKLIVCMNIVIQAVKTHINKSNDPIFRNGLLALVNQVEASLVNVRASIKYISAERGLDIKSAAIFYEKASVADEQFHRLWQGLNGLRHPHLLSPLREEARRPPVSPLHLTTEGPDVNDVPMPEFIAAESENRNQFIQSHLNDLDKDSGAHVTEPYKIKIDNHINTPVICDKNPVQTIKDLDLLPIMYKVLNAVQRKDLTVLNLICTEVVEVSNCYAQAVKMALILTDVDSQQLENLKSDTITLTHVLVQTAQEIVMDSFTSTECFYKHLTMFSDKISQMHQILLPIAGTWYHAIFQSQSQKTLADTTEEIRNVMCACADIVDLVISSDILQGKHQESVTTLSRLQAAQVNAKYLTEMATSIPPGSDKLEATSILWALSIQVLLSSLDKILGLKVEGGRSLFNSHTLTAQQSLLLMSENSVRIQEASRLSSSICRSTNTVKRMRDLQQEVKSLTEAYLQAAEKLSTAPLYSLHQLARTELLKRTLQIKVKTLCAVVSKVNKEYMDAIQHVIHLAVLANDSNGCIGKWEAAQLEFEKSAELLLDDMKAVSDKVLNCLNFVRNPRVRAALRFTNEHLSSQMSDIVSRARQMLESQNSYDLLSLEIHMLCWSAKAHFLVVEINKVEGIHPGTKQQVTVGLQGKRPAEISSVQVEEKRPSTPILASSPSDSAANISEQKMQAPPEAEQLKKVVVRHPMSRRTEPSLSYTSLYLKRETEKRDVQNNHVVQVTGDLAEKIHHMAQYLRKKGPIQGKEAFVSTTKNIISSCQAVTRFLQFVTTHCLDKQCRDDLVRIMERISTTTNQLTIISSVNAVTAQCRSSDEILVKNAQDLLLILLQGIRTAETACIKGLKQPEPESEGAEATALCFQWRQNLLIHRAQQNSNLETNDLGLRKICQHEAAPSLVPPVPLQVFYR